jgi:hypothetical protein
MGVKVLETARMRTWLDMQERRGKRRYGVRRREAWKVLPEVVTQRTAYPTLRTSSFRGRTLVP